MKVADSRYEYVLVSCCGRCGGCNLVVAFRLSLFHSCFSKCEIGNGKNCRNMFKFNSFGYVLDI